MTDDDRHLLVENRRARHDYTILERWEAGIALVGTEVKSVRAGHVQLRESFARVERGRVVLYNAHISEYEFGNRFNHDPVRPRQLLLHKEEIRRLAAEVKRRGLTLIPLSLYLRDGRVKVELALAAGRHAYDKRQAIARREAEREAAVAAKQWQRTRG